MVQKIYPLLLLLLASGCQPNTQTTSGILYDWVIKNGRVIDPATRTDKILNIGITNDSITAISEQPLAGKNILDATDLVVAPGFIDLHSHTPTPSGQYFQLKDGVTTALDLEAGAFPLSKYGEFVNDKAILHYGASVGYFAIRIKVIEKKDEPYIFSKEGAIHPEMAFTQPANQDQIEQMRVLLQKGLQEGGFGIGLLLDYMDKAITEQELQMIFEVATQYQAPIWVHLRRGVQGDITGLEEIVALSIQHQTPVHICHIQANAMGQIEKWLARIDAANLQGGDISMEMYPYTAGSTSISADVFNRDWQTIFGITYEDVQWADTGEFLTKETWDKYRQEQPSGTIIHHYGNETWNKIAVQHPQMIIASDAMPVLSQNKKVTPRGIGTFSKTIAKYAREEKLISLSEAIAKASWYPAKRLEKIAPLFSKKGRITVGADADLTIFDYESIQDKGTYLNPYQESEGVLHVFVNGILVLKNGQIQKSITPGTHLNLLQR